MFRHHKHSFSNCFSVYKFFLFVFNHHLNFHQWKHYSSSLFSPFVFAVCAHLFFSVVQLAKVIRYYLKINYFFLRNGISFFSIFASNQQVFCVLCFLHTHSHTKSKANLNRKQKRRKNGLKSKTKWNIVEQKELISNVVCKPIFVFVLSICVLSLKKNKFGNSLENVERT